MAERDYAVVQQGREKATASEWREMSFSEAVLVNPVVRLDRGKTYPFVDMRAVNAGSRRAHPSSQREFRGGGGSRFQCGDTLMARITPSLENGKIARYHASATSDVAHGSTEFIVIRGRPGVTDTHFAYYLTKCTEVRDYAISQMSGTSGRQRVPVGSLDHLSVTIPSLPEQRAIAHVLDSLDSKIELNRRMCETLEDMARILFKSWFVAFDPVRAKMDGRWRRGESLPGLPAELYDLFPDHFEDSYLGEIPAGWEVRNLDCIADFTNGLALQRFPPQEDNWLPVIKIAEMKRGYTIKTGKASSTIDPRYIVEDGDLLFSWSGSLELVLWTHGRGVLNQHLFKVTSTEFPLWYYMGWTREHLANFRRIAAGKATTMGHIQRHHLTDAKVFVPSPEILAATDTFLLRPLEQQVRLAVQSRCLLALRDALLPRLMSGELRIGDVGEVVGC